MILIFSSRNIVRTGLHGRRLGYNSLDTLNVSRDGLIMVDLYIQLADGQIITYLLIFILVYNSCGYRFYMGFRLVKMQDALSRASNSNVVADTSPYQLCGEICA